MAQGIFLHEYNTGGKLYDGAVSVANNKLANRQYVIDNAALQSNNLSDLDSAETARTNLGVAIGSDVQAFSARLGELAALSQSDGSFVVSDGSSFVFESGATARASLGLTIGTHVQAFDAQLSDVAGLTPSDGNFIVGDGSNFVAESGSTARASLGLTIGSDVQAYDAELAALAGLTSAANKLPMFSGSGTATLIDFVDEDDMASNSATAVPSQQSVKAYVDGVKQGLDIKDSVRVATTAAGTLSSAFANGQTVDGVSLATGDRILIKDQTDATENGVYTVNASGAPTRATDFDSSADVTAGAFVFVAEGTANADSGFVLTTNDGTGDIDPDTSSRYTGFDPVFGSATTLTGMTLSSATLNASSNSVSYSAGNDAVTLPANGVIIFSDGSDTIAFRLQNSSQSINSGSGSISFANGATVDTKAESSVTSMATSDITGITFKSLTSEGFHRKVSGNQIDESTTSIAFGGAASWPGGTVPSGKYIEFKDGGSTFYYRTTAELSNGDFFVSVVADTDASSSTTYSNLFPGHPTQTNFFNSQGSAAISPGTTELAFTQFSGAGQITAGTGLVKSGNTISATGGLADIAGLAKTDGGIIVGDGSNFVLESGSTARASLGAQASHARLDDISGLAVTDGGIIVGDGSNFVLESGATARASLGVAIGSDVQAYDAQLDTLSGFTAAQVTRGIADDNLLTVDDADAADNDYAKFTANGIEGRSFSEVRTDLGLVIGTDVQAYDAQLDTLSGFTAAQVTRGIADDNLITADCASHAIASGDFARFTADGVEGREASQVRSDLSLVPGTDVQAYDAELAAIAGLTSAADKGIMFNGSASATTFDLTAAGRALLDDADAAAMRSTLGLVIGTDVAAADSTELSVTTSEPSSIAIGDVGGMFVYDLSGSSSHTVSLPSTATSGCLGKSIIFKVKSTVNSQTLTINPASNQTIEGESSIVLNQERQSIRLVISEEYSSGSGVQCWVAV